jgi:hypothetical protein
LETQSKQHTWRSFTLYKPENKLTSTIRQTDGSRSAKQVTNYNSLEPIMKGQDNDSKVGDHEKSKLHDAHEIRNFRT